MKIFLRMNTFMYTYKRVYIYEMFAPLNTTQTRNWETRVSRAAQKLAPLGSLQSSTTGEGL